MVDPEGEVFGLWEWKTGGSWWSYGWSSGVVRFGPEEDEDRDEDVKSVSLEELGEPCRGSWAPADMATNGGTLGLLDPSGGSPMVDALND